MGVFSFQVMVYLELITLQNKESPNGNKPFGLSDQSGLALPWLGFVTEGGERVELEKVIDEKNNSLL